MTSASADSPDTGAEGVEPTTTRWGWGPAADGEPTRRRPLGRGRSPRESTVVAVLADTHLVPGRKGALPVGVTSELERADVILHAGDVLTADLLDDLATYAPVHTVLGNNDQALIGQLPDRLELTIGGVRVAMVHDSGARKGRERRMRRWFPDAQVVVFGHSHEPIDDEGEDGQRLFNPGSPTQRRRQPHRTMGVLELAEGEVVKHEILVVDEPR